MGNLSVSAYPTRPPDAEGTSVPASELVTLCAGDSGLYCQSFFPHTFRQKIPRFHTDMWRMLESRANRYVAFMVFRGGAKTTTLRALTSKRIAYGTSRTIMFVSISQDHAVQSLAWLRKAVEFNQQWAQTYALQRGKKWTDEHIEIHHGALDITISVVAVGITGQTRGLNLNDYRPDLIVVDDPCDEENTATPEQRTKLDDRFFGALAQSLAPRSECPDAKMVLLQTPLNQIDLVNQCMKDKAWASVVYGILDENEQSRWPERYPTVEVLQERQEYADRNQLPTWLREKQCKVVHEATSSFRREWLQYWDVLPPRMVVFMGIDPVPPPSDLQISKGLADKDYECLFVLGLAGGKFYVLEISTSRGHEPEWTVTEFFRLLDKWKPLKVRVEGIGYQRALKSLLDRAMRTRKRFVQVDAVTDKRKKYIRILDAFSGIASNKRLYIHREMVAFESAFISYPNVIFDDVLDAGAMAIDCALDMDIDQGSAEDETETETYPDAGPVSEWRTAP